MHVVGARFANLESANAALSEIRSSVPIPRADVAVRPLGSTRYEQPASGFVLAGRFPAVEVERVLGIVKLNGGTLLSRHVERPHPVLTGSGGTRTSIVSRDERGRALERHGSEASRSEAVPAPLRRAHQRLRRPAAPLRIRAARGRGFSF
jgi:hypothetical protein